MHSTISPYLSVEYDKTPDVFFWPVSRNNAAAVRNRFMQSMIKFSKLNEDKYQELYPVLSLLWVNNVIQAYQFSVAIRYFRQNNISPHSSGDNGFFEAVFNRGLPPIPSYVSILEKGLPKSNMVLENLRGIKRAFGSSPISYKPSFLINFQKDVIINSTGELIFTHAQSANVELFYVPREFWFGEAAYGSDTTIESDGFIEIIRESFALEHDVLLPELETWLREIYVRSLRACEIHIERLLKKKNTIPMRYWMGSGGVMWDRIMKYIVKKVGGVVTGHDHGSGIGHLKSVSRALSECNDCDYFVSFSQNEDIFHAALDKNFLFDGVPHLLILPSQQKRVEKDVANKHDGKSIQKILIIPYGPDGNTARFITTPHDSVKVDFLVRIMQKLKSWDYDVYLKPHPHCPLPVTEKYLHAQNVNLLNGPIEDAFDAVDGVLFMHHYTTTFRQAFEFNLPIILIDPAYEEWASGAYEHLEKRVGIVKSEYDEKNRISVDWDALKNAVSEAPLKKDTAFYQRYYQNL